MTLRIRTVRQGIAVAAAVLVSACKGEDPRSVGRPEGPEVARRPDDMVQVGAGWFTMGCARQPWPRASGIALTDDDAWKLMSCVFAEPPRRVWVSGFEADRRPVTRGEFHDCVVAGACAAARHASPSKWYGSAALRYPEHATYAQAAAFCRWRGKRLLTEAEWEKTARGGDDERIYPWGDDAPSCDRGVSDPHLRCALDPILHPADVGAFPKGRSATGADDMARGDGEWTSTWWSKTHARETSPDAAEGAELFRAEMRGDNTFAVYQWSAMTFDWPGLAIIDPQGPATPDPNEENTPEAPARVVKGWQADVAFRVPTGHGGEDDSRVAAIRCARSIPGPPPPPINLPKDEFRIPFREPTAAPK